jgi:L-lactate utilization protein LutB
VHAWHNEALAFTVVAALRHNGFKAEYCKDREELHRHVEGFLAPGISVGFGGSMTVRELGIQDLVRDKGCALLDHNAPGLEAEARMDILRRQLTSDLFISGTNAITLEGELINVDGNGNRVAALSFGPKKTLVIAGVNKIVHDLDEAFARIELVASPKNNKRLNKPNPCTKTGYCMDCDGETRICRIYSVLRRRPSASDFTVLLVGEALGY